MTLLNLPQKNHYIGSRISTVPRPLTIYVTKLLRGGNCPRTYHIYCQGDTGLLSNRARRLLLTSSHASADANVRRPFVVFSEPFHLLRNMQ